jgi:hypothetical protein
MNKRNKNKNKRIKTDGQNLTNKQTNKKTKKTQWAGRVTQVVECLPCKP